MGLLQPLERALSFGGSEGAYWRAGPTFQERLRRLKRRRVRVVTIGGSRCVGRLLAVHRDYIVIKTNKRRVLIRLESIAWVSRARRRRRRRKRCCCR